MQQHAFQWHRSSTFCLVMAASACAAESGDEDTGADTGMSTVTSPTTNPTTDPSGSDDDDGTTTDPPGDDTAPSEDATSSPESSDEGIGDSGGDSSGDGGSTGAEGSTVVGTVSRSAAAAIAGGNDGIGMFYLGVLVACSQDAASVAANAVMVDLSAQNTPAVWDIPGVPDGNYFIAGFLDDNGNADMNDPYADVGDLAAAEGFGPACLEINVAGGQVAAGQMVLNIAVPF